MSLIDKAVTANRNYAKKPDPKLRERPTPRLAVVTCMDPRLSDLPAILGLPPRRTRRYPNRWTRGDR